MSQTQIGPERPLSSPVQSGVAGVKIDATRARQTEAPPSPFRDVLAGGVSVLMGGAAVATNVLGAPVLAAAVQTARAGATTAILGTGSLPGRAVPAGPASALAGAAVPAGVSAGDGSDLATMQAMQRESQAFNLQLLNLQEEVQQENRRFSTLSNVLRAKHDTAKAAVSNIRS
jgi:hypothetical protein